MTSCAPLRILHLTRDLPPAGKGGVSTAVSGLVRASVAAGWQVAVLSFDGWRPRRRGLGPTPARPDRQHGASVLRLHGPDQLDEAAGFLAAFAPDLLHAHQGLVWCALADHVHAQLPPMVFTAHVAQAHMRRLRGLTEPTLSERAQQLAFVDAARIIAPSSSARHVLAAACPARASALSVIGLGVDAAATFAQPAVDPPGPAAALYAGRFDTIKGTDVLLAALPLIVQRHGDARFVLAGGMPDNRRGERRWRKRWQSETSPAVQAAVRWTGWLPAAALAAEMDAADVLVVPSRFETFGLSALEGMARGMAVVASRCGGLGELIEDGVTGLLVPPDEPAALADAVAALLGDAGLRRVLGTAAASSVRERWSWRPILAATDAVYRQALEG